MDTIDGVANSTPGVGHIKGLVHLAFNQEKKAHQAFLASNRTTG